MRPPFALVVLVFAATTCGQSNFSVTLFQGDDARGKYQYVTDTTTLEHTPEWNPAGGGDPPLLPAAAIQKAREAGRQQFPKADDVAIISLQLSKSLFRHVEATRHENLTRWYYVVYFSPVMNGETYLKESLAHCVVLMDGSVLTRAGIK
jgi:hypothetical protein